MAERTEEERRRDDAILEQILRQSSNPLSDRNMNPLNVNVIRSGDGWVGGIGETGERDPNSRLQTFSDLRFGVRAGFMTIEKKIGQGAATYGRNIDTPALFGARRVNGRIVWSAYGYSAGAIQTIANATTGGDINGKLDINNIGQMHRLMVTMLQTEGGSSSKILKYIKDMDDNSPEAIAVRREWIEGLYLGYKARGYNVTYADVEKAVVDGQNVMLTHDHRAGSEKFVAAGLKMDDFKAALDPDNTEAISISKQTFKHENKTYTLAGYDSKGRQVWRKEGDTENYYVAELTADQGQAMAVPKVATDVGEVSFDPLKQVLGNISQLSTAVAMNAGAVSDADLTKLYEAAKAKSGKADEFPSKDVYLQSLVAAGKLQRSGDRYIALSEFKEAEHGVAIKPAPSTAEGVTAALATALKSEKESPAHGAEAALAQQTVRYMALRFGVSDEDLKAAGVDLAALEKERGIISAEDRTKLVTAERASVEAKRTALNDEIAKLEAADPKDDAAIAAAKAKLEGLPASGADDAAILSSLVRSGTLAQVGDEYVATAPLKISDELTLQPPQFGEQSQAAYKAVSDRAASGTGRSEEQVGDQPLKEVAETYRRDRQQAAETTATERETQRVRNHMAAQQGAGDQFDPFFILMMAMFAYAMGRPDLAAQLMRLYNNPGSVNGPGMRSPGSPGANPNRTDGRGQSPAPPKEPDEYNFVHKEDGAAILQLPLEGANEGKVTAQYDAAKNIEILSTSPTAGQSFEVLKGGDGKPVDPPVAVGPKVFAPVNGTVSSIKQGENGYEVTIAWKVGEKSYTATMSGLQAVRGVLKEGAVITRGQDIGLLGYRVKDGETPTDGKYKAEQLLPAQLGLVVKDGNGQAIQGYRFAGEEKASTRPTEPKDYNFATVKAAYDKLVYDQNYSFEGVTPEQKLTGSFTRDGRTYTVEQAAKETWGTRYKPFSERTGYSYRADSDPRVVSGNPTADAPSWKGFEVGGQLVFPHGVIKQALEHGPTGKDGYKYVITTVADKWGSNGQWVGRTFVLAVDPKTGQVVREASKVFSAGGGGKRGSEFQTNGPTPGAVERDFFPGDPDVTAVYHTSRSPDNLISYPSVDGWALSNPKGLSGRNGFYIHEATSSDRERSAGCIILHDYFGLKRFVEAASVDKAGMPVVMMHPDVARDGATRWETLSADYNVEVAGRSTVPSSLRAQGGLVAEGAQLTKNGNDPYWAAVDSRGRVISGNMVDAKVDPASTTKMMVLKTISDMVRDGELPKDFMKVHRADLERMVRYTRGYKDGNAMAEQMGRLAAREALKGVAAGSGDPATRFYARMQQMAEESGMVNTHFATMSGMNSTQHWSTTADMARFGHAFSRDALPEARDIALARAGAGGARSYAGNPGTDWGKTGTARGDHGRFTNGNAGGRTVRSWVGASRHGTAYAVAEALRGEYAGAIRRAAEAAAKGRNAVALTAAELGVGDGWTRIGDQDYRVFGGATGSYDIERERPAGLFDVDSAEAQISFDAGAVIALGSDAAKLTQAIQMHQDTVTAIEKVLYDSGADSRIRGYKQKEGHEDMTKLGFGQDGKLTINEVIHAMDIDGDGKVSLAETRIAIKGKPAEGAKAAIAPLFKAEDVAKLAAEFKSAIESMEAGDDKDKQTMKRLAGQEYDTDGTTGVSPEELHAYIKRVSEPKAASEDDAGAQPDKEQEAQDQDPQPGNLQPLDPTKQRVVGIQ